MDTGLRANTTITVTTDVLPHKTCDSHLNCDGPSLGQTRRISCRDAIIIGAVLGGTAAIVVALCVFCRWRTRRAKIREARRIEKGKGKETRTENVEDKTNDVGKVGEEAPPASIRPEDGECADDLIRPVAERSVSWADC
ncbi:hypothetical protein F5B22DRAFT_188703 [Xylaria bambusicola]|uniref:uncharacterized protein n=1 Tax=Xylaria bambusicola TaxID=326684 RepID=UPI0020076D5D|nr:uncharacterized protein F5B22DRAFT_188703 [Xylaria bambusicola]KAI0515401.1 hypothetical protein F5B22DRAFT_188703 [Xylaria bambusicola]